MPTTALTLSPGLQAQALAAEAQRHQQRLKEIQAMAPLLAQVDAQRTLLQSTGVKLDAAQMYTLAQRDGTRALMLSLQFWDEADASYHALLRAGFAEKPAERTLYGTFCSVSLQKDGLTLVLHISTKAADGPTQRAQRSAFAPLAGAALETHHAAPTPTPAQKATPAQAQRGWLRARTGAAMAALLASTTLAACGGGDWPAEDDGTATTQPVHCTQTPKACT